MSWIEQAIADFGQTLGIPRLTLDAHGRLELDLDAGKTLHIHFNPQADEQAHYPGGQAAPPELWIAVAQPMQVPTPAHNATVLRSVLRLTDFRQAPPWPLQAALQGESLLLAMRIPERECTVSAINQAREHLDLLLGQALESAYASRSGAVPGPAGAHTWGRFP